MTIENWLVELSDRWRLQEKVNLSHLVEGLIFCTNALYMLSADDWVICPELCKAADKMERACMLEAQTLKNIRTFDLLDLRVRASLR